MAQLHMNVEIGTEAAQFPEKEYISGIFLAVQYFKKIIAEKDFDCGRQSPRRQSFLGGKKQKRRPQIGVLPLVYSLDCRHPAQPLLLRGCGRGQGGHQEERGRGSHLQICQKEGQGGGNSLSIKGTGSRKAKSIS
jgi:hypothetical protein